MSRTSIEWADKVWQPMTGCTKVSDGCKNCYASRMANRLAGRFGYPANQPFAVTLHPDRLTEPLTWKKPSRIFVCSMGDLFHEDVPEEFIWKVLGIAALAPQHTFLLLTKRPERMAELFSRQPPNSARGSAWGAATCFRPVWGGHPMAWPLPNVWAGVTAENQAVADERIPLLLQTPAAVRFVSVEPMLSAVDLSRWLKNTITCGHCGQEFDPGDLTQVIYHETIPHRPVRLAEFSGAKRMDAIHWLIVGQRRRLHAVAATAKRMDAIHWLIVGGESGPGARPLHPDWVRGLRDQAIAAGVPFLFKQWGEWCPLDVHADCFARNQLVGIDGTTQAEYCGWGCDVPKRGWASVHRVGKKAAGRLLDGKLWDEYPEVARS